MGSPEFLNEQTKYQPGTHKYIVISSGQFMVGAKQKAQIKEEVTCDGGSIKASFEEEVGSYKELHSSGREQ